MSEKIYFTSPPKKIKLLFPRILEMASAAPTRVFSIGQRKNPGYEVGTFVGEPLNHIHQDTKSARLIAVCKRTNRQKTKISIKIRRKAPWAFVQKQTVIFEENPKWRIYKSRFVYQIGPLSRDRARILYLIILCCKRIIFLDSSVGQA